MYKVLILTWKVENWEESKSSIQALGYNLYQAFQKKKKSKIIEEIYYIDKSEDNLPEVDFVILITYASDNIDCKMLKDKTKAIKVCTSPIELNKCDFSFIFNPVLEKRNTHLFQTPYNNSLLKPTIKTNNTILIDHYWKSNYFGQYENSENGWTTKIENWIEDIKDDFKIYRLIRFPNEEKDIKSFEIPIKYSGYTTYLENTKFIQNFIITHMDSYSFGIIDMAVRGTRIFSPEGFLPECQINNFDIQTFSTKNELINDLKTSYNFKKYKNMSKNCLDFDNIVKTIHDNYFIKWFNEHGKI